MLTLIYEAQQTNAASPLLFEITQETLNNLSTGNEDIMEILEVTALHAASTGKGGKKKLRPRAPPTDIPPKLNNKGKKSHTPLPDFTPAVFGATSTLNSITAPPDADSNAADKQHKSPPLVLSSSPQPVPLPTQSPPPAPSSLLPSPIPSPPMQSVPLTITTSTMEPELTASGSGPDENPATRTANTVASAVPVLAKHPRGRPKGNSTKRKATEILESEQVVKKHKAAMQTKTNKAEHSTVKKSRATEKQNILPVRTSTR